MAYKKAKTHDSLLLESPTQYFILPTDITTNNNKLRNINADVLHSNEDSKNTMVEARLKAEMLIIQL